MGKNLFSSDHKKKSNIINKKVGRNAKVCVGMGLQYFTKQDLQIQEELKELYGDKVVSNIRNKNEDLYLKISRVAQQQGRGIRYYVMKLGFKYGNSVYATF